MPDFITPTARQVYEDVVSSLKISKIDIPLDYNTFFLALDMSMREVALQLVLNKQWATTKVLLISDGLHIREEFQGIPLPSDYIYWQSLVLHEVGGSEFAGASAECRYTNVREFFEVICGYVGRKYINYVVKNAASKFQPVFTIWGNSWGLETAIPRTMYLYYSPPELIGQFRYYSYPSIVYDMESLVNVPIEYYNMLTFLVLEKIYRKYGFNDIASNLIRDNLSYTNKIDYIYNKMFAVRDVELTEVKGLLKLQEEAQQMNRISDIGNQGVQQ